MDGETSETTVSHAPVGEGWAGDSAYPRLVRVHLLRGCNAYHTSSVLRAEVDPGPLAGWSTADAAPGFAYRYRKRFSLPRGGLQGREPGPDFLSRLASRRGIPLSEALLEAVLAVETVVLRAMFYLDRIEYAFVEIGDSGRRIFLTWETFAPDMSRRSVAFAVKAVADLLARGSGQAEDEAFAGELAKLVGQAERRRLSGSTSLLKSAARCRGLPHECVSGQHLRLGQGVRQHQLFSSLTGSTSFGAVKMALDKRQSNRRLSELSLPVPLQLSVASAEEAVAALGSVGTPAVIKPIKGNQGRGVTTGIWWPEEVAPAFEHALSEGSGVLVETWVPGTDYRLLVVGGRFVAALTCLPPSVQGDGRRTLRDLIDELNREPDRDDIRLSPVPLDAHLERHLLEQGCSLDTVPAQGRVISLRATGHVATGGIPIDVTDRVHPDNQRIAEKAALAIGLEVAGVDFVTTDISRSYREIGGQIIEVNSRPGLGMHVWPREGKSRDVAGAILDLVFPDRRSAFVPTILVAGDRGTGSVVRAVEGLLRAKGLAIGSSLKNGAYLNGLPLDLLGPKLARAPKILLRDPSLECLVSAVSLRRATSHGLHLETCDAAAILPREHHDDLRAFESGMEILRKANSGRFVISTRNREARAALAAVDPSRLILISAQSQDAEIKEHIAAGRSAIVKTWRREGPTMTLVEGGREVTSAPLKGEAHARSNSIQADMYAFALAYAGGLVDNSAKLASAGPAPKAPAPVRKSRGP